MLPLRRAGEERGPIRAFFAIELGAAARAEAAELARRLREAPGGDGVRWVRPEALHVTLRFLGEIDPARAPALAGRVRLELAPLAPFVLRLGPAELFPTPRRPRVVALGLEPAGPLAELAGAVERAVLGEGFAAEERGFRAHLTLGRVRDRRFPAVAAAPLPAAEFPVEEVVLFRSELGASGSRYTALERVSIHHPI